MHCYGDNSGIPEEVKKIKSELAVLCLLLSFKAENLTTA